MSITLPELLPEIWLEIFDKIGPSAQIPRVCTYFRDLYKKMATIWAERLVDKLQDCYKQQSPARGIPRGCMVTYEKGKEIIKHFKRKIYSAQSGLSRDEQDRYKSEPFALAVHPELLNTILPIIDEIELIKLIARLPNHLRAASRTEQIHNLTELDLANNQLTALPASIGSLSALTQLDLSDNELATLPSAIGNLSALDWLNLSNNQLTTLPDSFGNLMALQFLDISRNPSLAQSQRSLIQLKRLRDNGCEVRYDKVVEEAIGALNQHKYLLQ